MSNFSNRGLTATAISLMALLAGCSSNEPPPPAPPPVYRVATSQLPPEPVYSRVSWAALPEPIPGALKARGARMSQKFDLSLSSATLGNAADKLGRLFGYRAYCAGTISDRRVTLKERGDLDELAEALAQEASIRVVVDHENRELRLFALETSMDR